jgi:tripartite-type tricarboxylate transporter receptor subunit TctC
LRKASHGPPCFRADKQLLKRCAFLFAALASVAVAPARAQDFAPRNISILIGFAPGQGNDQPARPEAAALAANRISPDMSYDQTARFLARHLGRFLPGEPNILSRHVPGGAGLTAARRLAASRPDGATIALLSSNVIYSAALRLPGAEPAVANFVWLGGVSADAWGCIQRHGSVGTPRTWFGSLGAGSRADVHARALREYLRQPVQIASGYVSRFELIRALETGEIDAACGWPITEINRRRADWIDSGRMDVVAMFSRSSQGANVSDEQAATGAGALRALAAEAEIAWPLAAPPGTPDHLAAAFSAALEQLAYDRAAIEDAAHAGVVLDPVPAETVRKRVAELITLPETTRSTLAKLFAPGGK